jgi:hypothetical protein
MAFRRENKISIENMAKFKEETKMRNRPKWKKTRKFFAKQTYEGIPVPSMK